MITVLYRPNVCPYNRPFDVVVGFAVATVVANKGILLFKNKFFVHGTSLRKRCLFKRNLFLEKKFFLKDCVLEKKFL